MGKLPNQCPQVACTLPTLDLVRAVLLEPARGLPLREPLAPGTEVSQQKVDPLLGVEGLLLCNLSVVHPGQRPLFAIPISTTPALGVATRAACAAASGPAVVEEILFR